MPETLRYPIGSTIIEIERAWQRPFVSPARNLAEAHRAGIQPVTFADIEQFCKDKKLSLANAVLTDESRDILLMAFPNNWRIVSGSEECLELQLTMKGTAPGLLDIEEFPRVMVGTHETLFTGLIIAQYTRKDTGKPISLQDYHDWNRHWGGRLPQPEVLLASKQLYLADKTGHLQPRQ